MDACMYILMNPNLKMSPGKLAAQSAHAAVEAFRLTGLYCNDEIIRAWYSGGHYKKIVLAADDLQLALMYLTERGIRAIPIIDEGRTEFSADLTLTAIGVPLVDKDDPHIADTFSAFKLYRERPQRPEPEPDTGLFGKLRSWFD